MFDMSLSELSVRQLRSAFRTLPIAQSQPQQARERIKTNTDQIRSLSLSFHLQPPSPPWQHTMPLINLLLNDSSPYVTYTFNTRITWAVLEKLMPSLKAIENNLCYFQSILCCFSKHFLHYEQHYSVKWLFTLYGPSGLWPVLVALFPQLKNTLFLVLNEVEGNCTLSRKERTSDRSKQ